MNEKITVEISFTGKNYCACVPLLEGCFTVSEKLDDIFGYVEESICLHLEGMEEDGLPIPEPFKGPYTYEYELSHSALFHWLSRYLSMDGYRNLFGMEPDEVRCVMNNRSQIPDSNFSRFRNVLEILSGRSATLKIKGLSE